MYFLKNSEFISKTSLAEGLFEGSLTKHDFIKLTNKISNFEGSFKVGGSSF